MKGFWGHRGLVANSHNGCKQQQQTTSATTNERTLTTWLKCQAMVNGCSLSYTPVIPPELPDFSHPMPPPIPARSCIYCLCFFPHAVLAICVWLCLRLRVWCECLVRAGHFTCVHSSPVCPLPGKTPFEDPSHNPRTGNFRLPKRNIFRWVWAIDEGASHECKDVPRQIGKQLWSK